MSKVKELEKKAKKEAVRVKGGGQFGMDEIAELPKALYCFTEKELEEYKEEIRNEDE